MSKEFIWNVTVGDEKKIWKCVVHEDEVVTYEDGVECEHLKITNPEVKQGVLQIDTKTKMYGEDVQFQLEKNIPYVKLGDKWSMSQTTYEDRKQQVIKNQKIAFILQLIIGIAAALACLVRYLVQGTVGDWWFLLVLASVMIATGFLQRYELKTQLKQLEKKDEQG